MKNERTTMQRRMAIYEIIVHDLLPEDDPQCTADSIRDELAGHGYEATVTLQNTWINGTCTRHPGAPVINGVCGVCTRYPAPSALDTATETS